MENYLKLYLLFLELYYFYLTLDFLYLSLYCLFLQNKNIAGIQAIPLFFTIFF
jgi:hypothetical protein